jgi:hypothetical protein
MNGGDRGLPADQGIGVKLGAPARTAETGPGDPHFDEFFVRTPPADLRRRRNEPGWAVPIVPRKSAGIGIELLRGLLLMQFANTLRLFIAALALATATFAQQPSNEPAVVPHLIRFNGSDHNTTAQVQAGVVGGTFSIYREQNDGTPLWNETQNVQRDKDGNYSVLLGSTRSEGMPVDLFTTTEPRWLEVEIDQVKQPRILLGSVPYALKSVDADTLGGLPPSAYLRVNPSINSTTNNVTSVMPVGLSPLASSGTPNCLAMFATDTTDVTNSIIDQTTYAGNPALTVGTPCAPGGAAGLGALTLVGNVPFGDAAGMALYNAGGGGGSSVSLDLYNTSSNGGIPQAKMKAIDDGNYSDHLTFWTKTPGAPTNAVTEKVRITSTGNVGIGTTTPSQKLEVNGSLTVDGNINLNGTIQSGSSGSPLFQAPATGNNFGAGYGALQSVTPQGVNPYGLFPGTGNTAVGSSALQVDTTGLDNTAVGSGALATNITGNFNTAIGQKALAGNTIGSSNTAVGDSALLSNTTGDGNTACGSSALANNTTGGGNTATGDSLTAGNYNTASGWASLSNNTSGSSNTAQGVGSLEGNLSGSNNIALGYQAGLNPETGSYNIMIGNQGAGNDDHIIRIGDVQTQTFIAGISGINVNGVPVLVSSSGQLGIASSSRRYKEDIQDMGEATADLMRLRPVTFRYKQTFEDGSKPIQFGLIAEEVEEVYPELVAHSADGKIETVKYQVLDSMLLNEVQRLNAQNTSQQKKIASLEQRLARLESLLEQTSTRTAPR